MVRRVAVLVPALLAVGLASGLAAPPAAAQLSPGALALPHAKLDGSRHCLECHRTGQGVDRGLCLKCHTALAARLASGQGLHARAGYERCERCHSEHNGASFQLVFWGGAGRAAFDHRDSGFALVGKHATLACERCHEAKRVSSAVRAREPELDPARTFFGLGTGCVDCHADPHRGQLAPAPCTDCHSQTEWKPAAGFDHSRTRYALTGAHVKTPCLKCHRQEGGAAAAAGDHSRPSPAGTAPAVLVLSQFRGAPLPACARCHEDVHRGKLGADCARCHDTASFRQVQTAGFDHDRTAYPLRGKHRLVACARCHPPGAGMRVARFDRCESCHVDPHLGQLVKAGGRDGCATCHRVEGFAPALYGPEQHAKSTFPLHDAHLAVPCVGCHRAVDRAVLAGAGRSAASRIAPSGATLPNAASTAARGAHVVQYRFAATGCRDCHRDPHGGQLDRYAGSTGCPACHTEVTWRQVKFDHEKSSYPLRGKHRDVACSRCHPRTANAATTVARLSPTGPPAGSPTGSRGAKGGGATLPTAPAAAMLRLTGLAKDCAGCHRDPHVGQLVRGAAGTVCERCHVVESFTQLTFDHQRDSIYALDGAHRGVPCAGCHPSAGEGAQRVVQYKPLPTTCEGCHRNDGRAKAGAKTR